MPTHEKRIYSQHGDAIRIVPLHLPDAVKTPPADAVPAAAASPPQLTYRNGPLLAAVEVFTIFWGPAWQTAQAALATQINGFFDFILTSPLIDQLAEYSVGRYAIGHGKRTGTTTITTPALKTSVSDTAIQHMLQTEISTMPEFPVRRRIHFTSSTCRPACRSFREAARLALVSVDTTTTYRVRFSMR